MEVAVDRYIQAGETSVGNDQATINYRAIGGRFTKRHINVAEAWHGHSSRTCQCKRCAGSHIINIQVSGRKTHRPSREIAVDRHIETGKRSIVDHQTVSGCIAKGHVQIAHAWHAYRRSAFHREVTAGCDIIKVQVVCCDRKPTDSQV